MVLRSTVTALIAILTMAGVSAQQAPTFSATTRLVTMAVSVVDDGRPVVGLSREDFEVWSDGRTRPIVQFTRETGPVTAALLVDASGSMEVNDAIEPAQTAARDLLEDLAEGVDRAGVFTFDRALNRRHDFALVSPALSASLQGTHAFGSTSLYDAVLGTSEAVATDGTLRRAVIVFTDGVDTSSLREPEDVRAHVASIDVPVYIIAIVPPRESQKGDVARVPPGHPLDALARGTGGQLFTVSPGAPMVRARASIVSSLRQHYLLAIEADPRPGWHSLSVRTRQKHTVRARAGYTVSPRT